MLAYNTGWINALETSRQAKRWVESRIISPEQYQAIKTVYTTPLYTPNVFIRIALYIFTAICVSGVAGLSSLFIAGAGPGSLGIFFIVLGIATTIALEVLIRERHLYCAGIDDALLYSALGFCIGGVLTLLFINNFDWPIVIPFLVALPFLVAATMRYADRLTALAAYACLLFIIGKLMVDAGGIVEALIPFAVMSISLVVYVACLRSRKQKQFEPWDQCWSVLEIASLATFYLGGNYLVVRQLTELLLKLEVPAGSDIPFALLFYILTVVVPVTYIVLGIRQRDSILLRVGLLATAFSVFTFKYYFSIAPPEVTLVLGGVVLIVAAIVVLRHLKTPRNGITREKVMSRSLENLDAEMIVISQTIGTTPQQPKPEFKLGGGEFGGGGSSGNW